VESLNEDVFDIEEEVGHDITQGEEPDCGEGAQDVVNFRKRGMQ
jgi:hypothetical protein